MPRLGSDKPIEAPPLGRKDGENIGELWAQAWEWRCAWGQGWGQMSLLLWKARAVLLVWSILENKDILKLSQPVFSDFLFFNTVSWSLIIYMFTPNDDSISH